MRTFIIIIALLWVHGPASAQSKIAGEPIDWAKAQPHWVAPFEPFRIIGNLYYVGTEGLAVYLVTGEEGHALIDGGLPGHEQVIIDNVTTLGFDVKDVKYLLNTHAHFDHSDGLAALKEASGAKLIASKADVSALEGGFYLGYEDDPDLAAPPVLVDHQILVDSIDRSAIIRNVVPVWPHLTPGHSRGCTSWKLTVEEAGEEYDVLIFCSATVAANRLVPEQYEGIVDDYRYTFVKTKDWAPDIFLANHPEVFHMKQTREKQKAGDTLAFVNRGAFQKYIQAKERAFEEALAEHADAVID